MFPNLAARETCVAETNFAARSQKHFCFPDTNFASETYVSQFSHPGKHNKIIVSARMFPSLARPGGVSGCTLRYTRRVSPGDYFPLEMG